MHATWARRFIYALSIAPNSILFFILMYAIAFSPYNYLASISTYLGSLAVLAGVYTFYAVVYAVLSNYAFVTFIYHDVHLHSHTKEFYGPRDVRETWITAAYFFRVYASLQSGLPGFMDMNTYPQWARTFSVLGNACYVMIPVLRVQEYPIAHNIFACGTVIFPWLSIFMLFLRRQCEDTYSTRRVGFMYLNLFFLVLIPALGITFACGTTDMEMNQSWSYWEYTTFFVIGASYILWLWDVEQDHGSCSCTDRVSPYPKIVNTVGKFVADVPTQIVPHKLRTYADALTHTYGRLPL